MIHVLAIFVIFHAGAIYRDDLTSLLPKILAIYSIHFAVMLGGVFGRKDSTRAKQVPAGMFWMALTLILIWNLLLVWRSVSFTLAAFQIGEDKISDYVSYLTTVSSSGAFLIVGALAYFFSK